MKPLTIFTTPALLISFAFGTSACSASATQTTPEPLRSIEITQEHNQITVHFQAISNGCTSDKHFEFVLKETPHANQLSITRTTPDRCRKMPKWISLTKRIPVDQLNPQLPLQVNNHFAIQ
jgi:hypothetical protein